MENRFFEISEICQIYDEVGYDENGYKNYAEYLQFILGLENLPFSFQLWRLALLVRLNSICKNESKR
jgi:hypothetical protein